MRRVVGVCAIVVVALGAAGWAAVRSGSDLPSLGSSDRPNLILIVSDDQPASMLSAMPRTRRLLGGHGVTFQNMFATTSLCCPSRASILTGRYSRHTGVYSNTPPHGGATSFDDASTLATWLHDAGYTTALVGKYLNGYPRLGDTYIPPGWDEWDAIDSLVAGTEYYDFKLNQNGDIVQYGGAPADYSTNVLAGRAVDFVENTTGPFFLMYTPIAPHKPAVPDPRDVGRFSGTPLAHPPSFNETDLSDKPWAGASHPRLTESDIHRLAALHERMLESLQSVDRSVAAIVKAVAARGGLRNTVIAYTSDNGFLLGQHRLVGKIWPYEESIRVPLVVRAPWVPAPGRTDDHMVLNIDLASTLADLAGVEPGLPQDGISLVPLLRSGMDPPGWRSDFVVEFLGHERGSGSPPRYEGLRTKRYLFLRYFDGARELYDLRRDPYELDNLARDPASRSLRRRLEERLRVSLEG